MEKFTLSSMQGKKIFPEIIKLTTPKIKADATIYYLYFLDKLI